jgi:hypothetical protein
MPTRLDFLWGVAGVLVGLQKKPRRRSYGFGLYGDGLYGGT